MSSTLWLVVIVSGAVLGAGLVALGNIKYTTVREAETKQELARQALLLITPETARNKEHLNLT